MKISAVVFHEQYSITYNHLKIKIVFSFPIKKSIEAHLFHSGRLGFGWVTDRKLMTLPSFMFCVLALQGVFVAVLPVASSLPAFVTILVLYSVAAGSLLVIFPVLVLHYIDINVQSVAIANVGLLSGITSFGIPPMIGENIFL